MNTDGLPKNKGAVNTERLTICVDKGLKEDLRILKEEHDIDHPSWIRQLIKDAVAKIKKESA